MKNICTLFTILIVGVVFAQKDEVLFTINNEPVLVSEFKNVYEKNLDLIDEQAKDIDKNLKLFIDYKLKVKEAYRLKLDTLETYKRELLTYRDQLVNPYLKDKKLHDKLLKEAYYRLQNEVRASHILLLLPRDKKADTVKIYNKLQNARKRIIAGESFEKVAKEVSEDPSVKVNGGDLGYFSAFRMIYEFEDKAYNTKEGEVSEPFKTKFGYHILKVSGKRKSKGEFDVAHILIKDPSEKGKARIDKVYSLLKKGGNFSDMVEKYTEDLGTKQIRGKLPRFGTGVMVKPFEDSVLALENEDDFTKPFKTSFGWHIVKLLRRIPVPAFETVKTSLEEKMRMDLRGRLSEDVIISRLEKKYNVTVNSEGLKFFKHMLSDTKHVEKPKEGDVLLTVGDKKITQKEFYFYLRSKMYSGLDLETLFNRFKNDQILNVYKDDLELENPEYRNTLKEYKEGLLLFELLQRQIWNASKDDEKIEAFYNKNKSNYKKTLKEIKGKVSSDYQAYLEKTLVENLRLKSKIKIKKKALKRIKKKYKK